MASNMIIIPTTTKILPCGKCSCDVVVSNRTIMAFCRDCSATLGEKK